MRLLLAVALLVPSTQVCAQALRPDTVSFASGALTLRGLVYRPAGAQRVPTILFNHGSGRNYDQQAAAVGPAYVANGFAVFAPSRRGQWLSSNTGGYILDTLDAIAKARGASARDPLLVEQMKGPQLDDVRAALAWLRKEPWVDTTRIIVAGNSFGGIVTVFAAANLDGLHAALDFAGAAQTWAGSPTLRDAMTDAVRHARVPILFVQAANDYNLDPSRRLSAAMNEAGKSNAMKIYPAFGGTVEEGHAFGYMGGSIWGPDVVRFVANPPRHH